MARALAVLAVLTVGSVQADENLSIHHVSPEACKQCHEEIYNQWKGSMHANSSALKDPIHV
jgi:hypothetical protein